MELAKLQSDMIAALKAGDKERKESISLLVAAVKKLAIDEGCRDDIKEELVDRVLLKEMKAVQEQIDTCPVSRQDLLEQYKAHLKIVSEYAPKLMGEEELTAIIAEKFADVISTKNKGLIMKSVMPEFKGKADGKLVNQVVAKLCAAAAAPPAKENLCPVCGQYEFKEAYDVCPVCGWENDKVQREDPDFAGGGNMMSLNQAKEAFRKGETVR